MLPALSNRCITFNESLHSKQLPAELIAINSDGQGSSIGQHNSTWDRPVHQSPLISVEESSELTEGIKGITSCKQRHNDYTSVTLPISNTQNKAKNRLPTLCANDHRRRWSQSNTKLKSQNEKQSNQSTKQSQQRRFFRFRPL